jgi:hypothetical protein
VVIVTPVSLSSSSRLTTVRLGDDDPHAGCETPDT